MKIIGIDPGITATGYGVIEDNKCLCAGTIRPRKKNLHGKVLEICEKIKQLIDENRPDFAVLEKVFHHKNIQSLIKSSELRGAIILTLLENKLAVTEYTPAQIKLTTTGNGRASKQQVRYLIEKMLLTGNTKMSNHATDAVAIAYTGARKMGNRL